MHAGKKGGGLEFIPQNRGAGPDIRVHAGYKYDDTQITPRPEITRIGRPGFIPYHERRREVTRPSVRGRRAALDLEC